MSTQDGLIALFDEYGARTSANLDSADAKQARSRELLATVRAARWRLIRNHRLLAQSARLQAEISWLIAENATLITGRQQILEGLHD